MAARRCFWSPSPGFYCFWVGGTRLNLVHALSRAHGCCPCCSASGFQSKAQSIWKGSAILWLEKLLCFWWWNSLFSIWTFSYSVSFIHKVPFCQKEMDTAGEMGRGRERERGWDILREREKNCGEENKKGSWDWWYWSCTVLKWMDVGLFFYLMDRLTDSHVLEEEKALNIRGVAWWGACAGFDVAASELHTPTFVHSKD